MTTPVDTGVPGFGYGLGLTVIQAPLIQAPEGRLIGHDGRRQLGVMLNELFAPDAVVEAYLQAWLGIGARLLEGSPSGLVTTSSSLRAALRAGATTPAVRPRSGALRAVD